MPEIARSVDGNIIGSIEGRVFTKRVQSSVHMLHTPRAWAIDCKAYKEQILPQADTIRIEDLESGTTYEISTKIFDDKKGLLQRDFGQQYYVVLKHWQQKRKEQPALL